jgi:phosphatidylserine/phosphatidylglycerophosphate/cardiolipin synthase-like enzyme
MRTRLFTASVLSLLAVAAQAAGWDGAIRKIAESIMDRPVSVAVTQQTGIEVGFSPQGGAEALVLKVIGAARESILVEAYSFTSKPIAEALVAAVRRGVQVLAVLDKSQRTESYSSATFLANSGVKVRIDAEHPIQHNKVLIVDGRHVQTGSYNYTGSAAKKNAENVIVIWENTELAREYASEFRRHWDHSTAYEPRY